MPDIPEMTKRSYTAFYVGDDGITTTKTVVLDTDILLQYCVAYDANDYETRSTIEEVAIGDEALLNAIKGLHQRFDLQEDFTPQLLAYRGTYAA